MVLCALRKLLNDLPGVKLPAEAFTVLARLIDVMRCARAQLRVVLVHVFPARLRVLV